MHKAIKNISFIGSGNLATQLGKAFRKTAHDIKQVYSRSKENADLLAIQLGAEAIDDLKHLNSDADIYIIAVNDRAIEEVAGNLNLEGKIIVHTSGSVSITAIPAKQNYTGVFYPLNTFSKNRSVDFRSTPVCIEAINDETKKALIGLAAMISSDVRVISGEQRLIIHAAAVFASNFVNHMYAISADVLESNGISFDIMNPIIEEVAEKIRKHMPLKAQTGPALREDHETLSRHIAVLKDFPAYRKLYEQISESIIKRHKS